MNGGQEDRVYSYHTFLLPFIWEKPGTHGSTELSRKYAEWQEWYIEDPDWSDMYSIDGDDIRLYSGISYDDFYREYKCFHPHVCESIYGCSEMRRNFFIDHLVVRCFTLMPGGEKLSGRYVIEKDNDRYILDVAGLELRFYNTGIGIYILKCENRDAEHSGLKDIERINDYGRRIAKPALENLACADRLTLDIKGMRTFTEEWTDSLDPMIKAGKTDSLRYISSTVTGPMGIRSRDIRLGTDEMMFAMSWIRGTGMISTQGMEILSESYDTANEEFLIGRFRTVYCQLAVLCIAQRASLINFGRKAEFISREIVCHGNNLRIRDKNRMINLQERYVAFLTQIDTYEVSTDEKLMSTYNLLRDALNINREKESIREKLDGLSALATAEQQFNFSSWAAAVAIAALAMTAGDLICESFSRQISQWIGGGTSILPALTAVLSIVIGLAVALLLRRRG